MGNLPGRRRRNGAPKTDDTRAKTPAPSTATASAENDTSNRKGSITGMFRDVNEDYEIGKQLGAGHYGKVRTAVEHTTGRTVAVKSITKRKVRRLHILKREIDIMRELDHPNIIRLHAVYEDELTLNLVMDKCTGGELFERIVKRGHYTEQDAAELVRQMLQALHYCHSHGVVHRDLKPENFLFENEADDSPLKLIDFGLSRKISNSGEEDFLRTRVGTPYYIAPEVLSRQYDKACDLWSTGVIMYILLCGYPPFWGDNDREIFARVRRGAFDFPVEEWDIVSPSAKDLIKELLALDPAKRPTAVEALRHPWLAPATEDVAAGLLSPRKRPASGRLADGVLRSIQRFTAHSQLKRAALGVIASKLSEDEIGGLKQQFEAIDSDKDGRLSVQELTSVMQSSAVGQDVEGLIKEVDADGNGEIDYVEFVAASMRRRHYMKEELLQHAFDHFDVDSTGFISESNLRAALTSGNDTPEDKALIEEILNHADVNQDGQIDFNEFKSVVASSSGAMDDGMMSSTLSDAEPAPTHSSKDAAKPPSAPPACS